MDLDNTQNARTRLITAGKSLIARLGYEQASTAAIAREAGTSESQLVRYFASKSGLLEAIFNQAWVALNERITEIVSQSQTERAAVSRIFRLMIEALDADRELGFIFLFEGRRVRGQEIALSKGFLAFYELIHQLIRRGQERGSFRNDLSVDVLASALLGCAEGMLRDRMIAERTRQPVSFSVADVERVFAEIVESMGPAPPPT